jgi:general stress protein YciG
LKCKQAEARPVQSLGSTLGKSKPDSKKTVTQTQTQTQTQQTQREDQDMATQAPKKSNRGFASMDREKQKEIASKGGKAAHAQGRAHEFTADEARSAGRKGGEAVSKNREHMAQIGRAGGQARGRNRAMADRSGHANANANANASAE